MKNRIVLFALCFLLFSYINAQDDKSREDLGGEKIIILGTSFDNNRTSYNAMFGLLKNIGVYGKFKTDFNFNDNHSFVLKESSLKDLIFWNGNFIKGRMSGTIGGLMKINNLIIPYIGIGYGKGWTIWETNNGSKVKINDYSYEGLEYEVGIITLLNSFLLSGGVSVNSFSHLEINIGVGISF